MKKYTYHISIVVLLGLITLSMYALFKDKTYEVDNQKELISNKTIDIKEEIKNREKRLLGYKVQKIDSRDLDKNISNLKQMLSKTELMLKNYNENNPQLITNQEIDKLVTLDLNQSPIENVIEEKIKNSAKTKEQDMLDEKLTSTKPSVYVSTSKTSVNAKESNATSTNNAITSTLTPLSTATTNSSIKAEVSQLQTQIDDVKKVITQVSSKIN